MSEHTPEFYKRNYEALKLCIEAHCQRACDDHSGTCDDCDHRGMCSQWATGLQKERRRQDEESKREDRANMLSNMGEL